MLKFIFKNMLVKKTSIILTIISFVLSCGVAILSYNVSKQISDGITTNASYYSVIVGPQGSSTELVMNSIYYTDSPIGTIPYELVSELSRDNRVKQVVPFAMADSYKGYKVVGTTTQFFNEKNLKNGELFNNPSEGDEYFEAVLGYTVASSLNLKVGDVFYTSHSVGDEHHTPFKVTGILEKTNSSNDTIVFTHLKSIWLVHEEGEEENHDGDELELNNMVCAILVKTSNPTYATALASDYNQKIFTSQSKESYALQAVEPMQIIRSVLNDVDSTKYIVYVLCAVILVMNLLIMAVITFINLYNITDEIEILRLIGISVKKINLIYLIQNSIIGIVSIVLSLILSRGILYFMQDYALSMGATLNIGLIYTLEWVILVIVCLINVLPTVVLSFILSKKYCVKG